MRLFGVNLNAKILCPLPLLRQINDRHYSCSNLHYTLPDTGDRTRACAKVVGTGLVRIQTAQGNEGANFYLYVYWEL